MTRLFFLHLSEQYFTSCQLFRQDFRHSMGFLQTTQILLSLIFLTVYLGVPIGYWKQVAVFV